ncbi:MAG: alpha-1,2-fucosyltransferase [Suilimivivens sp.]
MDIIRMTGGLGNQMFQYALYLKLTSMGRNVKFDDVSEYVLSNARPVMLWTFGIEYPAASKEEINTLTDGFMGIHHRVRRKLFGRKSLEYREKDCNFDEQVLNKSPAYLTGYFQSEKYFEDIKEQVREAFTFQPVIYSGLSEELKEKVNSYERQIAESLGISVHIRRGDYLTTSEVYGGNCTEEYYLKAVSLMRERYPEAVFYVFSNDSGWASEWIKRNDFRNFVLIEGFSEDMGYLDMMLMSRCKHHIIANSSFSWWGAYLSSYEKKTVIAPANWFNNQKCIDIYTREMIKISSKGELLSE